MSLDDLERPKRHSCRNKIVLRSSPYKFQRTYIHTISGQNVGIFLEIQGCSYLRGFLQRHRAVLRAIARLLSIFGNKAAAKIFLYCVTYSGSVPLIVILLCVSLIDLLTTILFILLAVINPYGIIYYTYTVWSAIGIILSSVCNAVHSGSRGCCTGVKVAPAYRCV